MFLIKLAAGLALITFGVRFLRKGLDRLFGGRLIVWLEKATKNRAQAMLAGAVTGTVAPSSTGLSLLTMQFASSGKIATDKVLAMLLGANVGMTLLVNIAAFQIENYVGLMLFFGVVGFQFTTRSRIRGIGQCLLSLGFIFLAMDFFHQAATRFIQNQEVEEVFRILNHYPVLLGAGAAIAAIVLQSSTAAIGLAIGLATGGALPGSLFVTWIVGTNLGIGCTSLFCVWNDGEGRRLGWANLIVKAVAAVLVLALGPLNFLLSPALGLPVSHQLAFLQTAFNVVAAIIALPFLNGLLTWVRRWIGADPAAALARKTFLDPQALESTSVALANATRETLRMTDEVREMLQKVWLIRTTEDGGNLKAIRHQDDTIDEINRQLMLYLSRIGELNDPDRRWHFILLTCSSELETVGDIIEKHFLHTVEKQQADQLQFAPENETVLHEIYLQTLQQFQLITSWLTTRDPDAAQQLIQVGESVAARCAAKKQSHYEHLRPGNDAALLSNLVFLDMLDSLRRISQHLTTVADEIQRTEARIKKTKPGAPAGTDETNRAQTPSPSA